MTIKEILEYNLLIGNYSLNLAEILSALLILLGAKLFVSFVSNTFLKRIFKKNNADIGRQFAVTQFLKYFVYTLAILWALETIGVELSVIWGGAAALLVGIGLGLQQTFNDLISGIILLIEGTVEVGDIVKVDGIVGTVIDIGIRTSKVETRDEISMIIPNSKLVSDNVVNWTYKSSPTRFQISIGVAYSSNIQLITALLLQAAEEHESVLSNPSPRVQFKDFGSSSLDFDLHFFSTEYLSIEFVKSDIRYRIAELFQKNDIEIPYPQRDIWIRNSDELKKG